MLNIESLRSAKVTRGNYLKTLSIAQGIIEQQTIQFINSGNMPALTIEQKQMINFSAMLKESYQMPKCLKAANCSALIDKVIKFTK